MADQPATPMFSHVGGSHVAYTASELPHKPKSMFTPTKTRQAPISYSLTGLFVAGMVGYCLGYLTAQG